MLYRVSFDLKQTRKIKNPAKNFSYLMIPITITYRYNIEGYVTA